MRLVLCFFFAVLLACAAPLPGMADEGGKAAPGASSFKRCRSECVPGTDPADPNCCSARLAVCRIDCTDGYAQSADTERLKQCERACVEAFQRCRAGE
ncbi:MAG: hypothetical protein AB7E46_07545 [Desulfovibrio sp.]|jgi:hypothetical protein